MAQSPEYPDLPWVPPRSYSTGRPGHQCAITGRWYPGGPRFIVVHYTAGAEGYDDAEGGAAYDQRRTDGTSSHYYVDADSVVQCVRTTDRSHTARQHGNLWGIHYELCGTAQTRAQWLDTVSRRTIRNAARQMARDMAKYKIPATRIDTQGEIRSTTAKGVCGHVDWTNFWPDDNGGRGTHTDPGAAFPWDVLLADITEFLGGDDMPTVDEIWNSEHIPAFRVDEEGRPRTPEDIAKNPTYQADNAIQLIGEEVRKLNGRVGRVETKVDQVAVGGVDVEALATRVADLLAQRLQS